VFGEPARQLGVMLHAVQYHVLQDAPAQKFNRIAAGGECDLSFHFAGASPSGISARLLSLPEIHL
jgi:hypothetical protein